MKLFALALSLFVASSAAAQKELPLPAELPPYGPETAVQAPTVQERKLDNGLTVWMVPRSGYPKVSLILAAVGGTAADPKERPGLAQLLAVTLSQGTNHRGAREIAEEMQGAGGDIATAGFRDVIRVSASVLSARAPKGLAVLADIVQNAAFPGNEVALAKRKLAGQLEQQEADPSFLASRAMAKTLFGDTPYAFVTPTKQSIEAATASELRSAFASRFRPDQALLVIVGDFQAGEMFAQVRDQFGGWRNPSLPPVPPATAPTTLPSHAIFLVPRPESVQTTLLFGAFGPLRGDTDYEAAEVANAIYGGSFGSRLTLNIREDKGYTYAPFSFLQIYRAAGVLQTRADVRNAVTGATFNEVSYEMNRMATTAVTDRELQQAKRFLVGLDAIKLQSQDAVAAELADLWNKGLSPAEIGLHGHKIGATTAANIESVSRKYFPASKMSIVAVGEEKVIRDALSQFGLPIQPAP
jgi:zinc protease